jgi:hypothetical protein
MRSPKRFCDAGDVSSAALMRLSRRTSAEGASGSCSSDRSKAAGFAGGAVVSTGDVPPSAPDSAGTTRSGGFTAQNASRNDPCLLSILLSKLTRRPNSSCVTKKARPLKDCLVGAQQQKLTRRIARVPLDKVRRLENSLTSCFDWSVKLGVWTRQCRAVWQAQRLRNLAPRRHRPIQGKYSCVKIVLSKLRHCRGCFATTQNCIAVQPRAES